MKTFLFSGLLLAGFLLGTGCSEKRSSGSRIEIYPSIRTRVSGLYFEKGDQIGLTILKGNEPYVQNYAVTYDGTLFSDSGLAWYDDSQQKATLMAYYPYMATGTPTEFSVTLDQRSGCDDSDLLGAALSDVVPVSTPVGMLFYHLMTQLTIVIDNTTDTAVTGVSISGFIPTADVDLGIPTAYAKSGVATAEIQPFEVMSGISYRAILVPQQGDLTVAVTTSDGKIRSKTVYAAQLESGKRYDLSIRVSMSDIEMTLSGEISDWVDGGTLDGSESSGTSGTSGGSDGSDESEGSELVYEGVTYPTVRIGDQVWMAANLRYQPAGVSIGSGCWYPQAGLDSDPELGLLYDYATATNGASGDGTPVQGICPDGWHIPNSEELQALVDSADRDPDLLKYAGFWIVTTMNERYGDSNTGYLMGSECPESEKCSCLHYTATSEPELSTISVNYGISVRCVQD